MSALILSYFLAALARDPIQQPLVEIVSSQPLVLVGVLISENGTVVVGTLRGSTGQQYFAFSRVLPQSTHVDSERTFNYFDRWSVEPSTAFAREQGSNFVWIWPECPGVRSVIQSRRFTFDLGAQPAQVVKGLLPEVCSRPDLDVSAIADRHAAVAWSTQTNAGAAVIYERRVAPSADASGETITVGSENLVTYSNPVIALDNQHRVTVVWERAYQGTRYVWARRFSSDATSVAGSQIESLASSADSPDVATMGDGRHVITWVAYPPVTPRPETFLQAFDAAGSRVGAAIAVSATTQKSVFAPAVAVSEQGQILSVSLEKGDDGANVVLHRFQFPTQRIGSAMTLSTSNAALNGPKVAINYHGTKWVVAWPESRPHGMAIVVARGDLPGN